MTKEKFWNLINEEKSAWLLFLAENKTIVNYKQWISPITEKLVFLEAPDIAAWFQIYKEYYAIANTNLLRLAGNLIRGNISSHGFVEFRSWLIAQGEEVYHSALINPEILKDVLISNGYVTPAPFKHFGYLVEYELCRDSNTISSNSLYYLTQKYPLSQNISSEIQASVQRSADSDILWEHLSDERQHKILPLLAETIKSIFEPLDNNRKTV